MTGETLNGRSISVSEHALAAEIVLGDEPRRRDAEHEVQRHDDAGDEQREADRGERVV